MSSPLLEHSARALSFPSERLVAPPTPAMVSVIMAAYNAEDSVLEAVASVLGQTYPHLELLVVDDGSTDDTLQRLAQVSDTRLTLLKQSNAGVARARNHALSVAKGEYVAFLDSDDCWLENYLEASLARLEQAENPHALVYSGYYGVDARQRLLNMPPVPRLEGRVFQQAMMRESVFLPSTTVMHRSIIETLGGFPEDCYHEDRAFFLRACRHYPAYSTGQRLVGYRQSTSGRCRRILADERQALKAELSIVSALRPLLTTEECARLEQFQLTCLIHRMLMYGYLENARNLYRAYHPEGVFAGKKGLLAWCSLKSGINLMAGTRVLARQFFKITGGPFWGKARRRIPAPPVKRVPAC